MPFDNTRWRLFAHPTSVAPAAAELDVHAQQDRIREAFKPEKRRNYDYLLIFRFLLTNLIGVTLVAAAYMHGVIDSLKIDDPTRLSTLTVGLFVAGLFLCGLRIVRISRELNEVRARNPQPDSKVAQYLSLVDTAGREGRAIAAEALRIKLISRIVAIRHIANTLVILGLLGTVVGFIISLGGVRPEVATNASAVTPMIATLVQGMSVALGNTLIGGVLNVWLNANYYILSTGTAQLICALLERGESHVAR
jgi:hypothetical protein